MVSVNMYIKLCDSAEDHGLRDYVAFQIPRMERNQEDYGFRLPNTSFKNTT